MSQGQQGRCPSQVQRWRERHPGYWRKKRPSRLDALQDLAPTEVSQNQPITINEIGLLADDFGLCEPSKHSEASRAGALQDLAYVQVPLLAGVVSLLIGDALQDRFATFTRELVDRGKRVLAAERS